MRLVNFEAMHKAIGLRINPKAPCSLKLLIGLYVVSVFTLFPNRTKPAHDMFFSPPPTAKSKGKTATLSSVCVCVTCCRDERCLRTESEPGWERGILVSEGSASLSPSL